MRTGNAAFGTFTGPPSTALRRFRHSLRGRYLHGCSEPFEPARQSRDGTLWVEPVEDIAALFAVQSSIADQVERDDQDSMCDSDDGLLGSVPARQAVEER